MGKLTSLPAIVALRGQGGCTGCWSHQTGCYGQYARADTELPSQSQLHMPGPAPGKYPSLGLQIPDKILLFLSISA